jgi:C4-type Zn-finger protein
MMKNDAICPGCSAGFRRIELLTQRGVEGEYRCPICDQLLEAFDGSTEIAYRLTITPVKAMAERAGHRANLIYRRSQAPGAAVDNPPALHKRG